MKGLAYTNYPPHMVLVTNFGIVKVSEQTQGVMNRAFPGWENGGEGAEALDEAVTALARLAFMAGQELVEI